MSADTNNLYVFKDFTLDIGESVLLRQGKPVQITPKAFQLLRILVEHHGSVVEKERLISEIWADSFVEDGNLAFTAQRLRKVLGDDAKIPVYIETVPRRGYRFIADVSNPSASNTVSTASDVEIPTNARPRSLFRIPLAVAVVILITVGWFVLGRNGIRTQSAPILFEPFKAGRLSSTGNAAQAAISPNGKLIAYTDQTGNGKWSVWLRQLSTAENIQILAPAELRYGGLAFSHDNTSLFMTRGGDRSLDIYRVNVFGGVPTKLVENTQGWISISPDDKLISFVRCEYSVSDYCSLFVVDVDGRNERRLVTRPAPIRIGDNDFSVDGRSIAFVAGQSRTGSDEFQLLQVDVTTEMETPITPERFFDIKSIEWLPSGGEILFTARPNTQPKFSIWKASLDTGSVIQLTRDDGNFSKLSLDQEARNLVVTKVDNNFAIYYEGVGDQTKRRALTPGTNCVFAPDGRIVFESNDRDIWIINADGDNKRQLTSVASADVNPFVTADGSSIVFSSNRSGINHVWRMNIDGSDQQQLTQSEGGHTNFVTSDGRVVYYTADITRSFKKLDVSTRVESDLPAIIGVAPTFSPDGGLVASFVRDAGDTGRLTIRIQDLGGKDPVRFISLDDNVSEPVQLQWSRDGQTITYVIRRSGEYELWDYSLQHRKRSLLAKLGVEPVEKVVLSPDGKAIATVRGSWLHDAFLVTGLRF